MNTLKVFVLLAVLTGLFVALGAMIGGAQGMMIAFLFAMGMNAFAYWNSDKMLLRMYGAREVDRASAPDLYALVQRLAAEAELPMPKVYVIDNPQPNAFATGRDPDHAAVAVHTGLLEMLSEREIAGVLAHELAHIKNRDTLIMTVTATIAGAIGMLANFAFFMGGSRGRDNPLGPIGGILIMLLAPIAATLVQLAISRSREYGADHTGARIARDPMGLASALRKISQAAHHVPNPAAERNPATAHLFIVNPLSGERMDNLFATHPSTENRVARLQALAQESGAPMAATAPAPRGAHRPGPWG